MKTTLKIIIIISIIAAILTGYILLNHKPVNKPAKPTIKPDTTKDSVWYDNEGNGHIRP